MRNSLPPKLDTYYAAEYIGCAPSTLKISRVTGRLLGHPAPKYIKYARKVVYDQDALKSWVENFGTRNNTAE